MLESFLHSENAFVTLTYADDGVKELSISDYQLWLKRFRKAIEPRKVRYFITGEYGEKFGRPHYHAALFGYPSCLLGGNQKGECQCLACLTIRNTWTHGHVMVGTLEPRSAAYVAGYVIKKRRGSVSAMRKIEFFSRMSLAPGIGAGAMVSVGQSMERYGLNSIPPGLRHGNTVLPLGRYLRSRLKELTGAEDDVLQKKKLEAQLQAVRSYAWAHDVSVAEVFAELNKEYEEVLQARERVQQMVNGDKL
jgi:hypothetical protein